MSTGLVEAHGGPRSKRNELVSDQSGVTEIGYSSRGSPTAGAGSMGRACCTGADERGVSCPSGATLDVVRRLPGDPFRGRASGCVQALRGAKDVTESNLGHSATDRDAVVHARFGVLHAGVRWMALNTRPATCTSSGVPSEDLVARSCHSASNTRRHHSHAWGYEAGPITLAEHRSFAAGSPRPVLHLRDCCQGGPDVRFAVVIQLHRGRGPPTWRHAGSHRRRRAAPVSFEQEISQTNTTARSLR